MRSRAKSAANAPDVVTDPVEAAPQTPEEPEAAAVDEAAPAAEAVPAEPVPETAALEAVAPEVAAPETEAAVPEPANSASESEATAAMAKELGVNQDVDKLVSLAEQVVHEAEAMAGDAAHNFQAAMKAATSGGGVVPTLGGVNAYLRQSVEINARFMEEFSKVRSPVDLVALQMRFLEEHRAAMLDFARQWVPKTLDS
ncbi:hypothetical protein JL101_013695 [Skermanella rosea]|uniref:hypothetical protein n=1 Tax=Skermanella rosea TaxID=1817965 RepID=UPI0019333488|nr:hypothetical protein [Skermanella rosea]UEM06437.1 hypothetical protein JL101_013695 [Skermanella rosea]